MSKHILGGKVGVEQIMGSDPRYPESIIVLLGSRRVPHPRLMSVDENISYMTRKQNSAAGPEVSESNSLPAVDSFW